MTTMLMDIKGVEIKGELKPSYQEILTPDALNFVIELEKKFRNTRKELLKRRIERQKEIDNGKKPDFLSETKNIRKDNWKVGETPKDLQDRRVEITGPVDRKMMINALNSGANVFMADLEDSNSPTWENAVEGQINLRDAVNKTISFVNEKGKEYNLNEQIATLLVRPRGWHLEEKHILFEDQPISGSLMDFGLYFFHNAKNLLKNGSGPYFYLPKLESHLEARLWNDVFVEAQKQLNLPVGTIKVTILIENILAAFEMEELLFELKDHIVGLNAGRWDYIFSAIKKFKNYSEYVFPDRSQITMTVPFMHAYTELLVKTCHKRGAHAIGGMSAFIPSRKDEKVNETAIKNVSKDKERESNNGFDGTWVAHPDLVPVVKNIFDKVLGEKPNQKDKLREDVNISANDLLNFNIEGGQITESGIRLNISVALLYMGAWLDGMGAVAIYNLMEDAATAEISRSQLWQWVHNSNAVLSDGREINSELYTQLLNEEYSKLPEIIGEKAFNNGKYELAKDLLNKIVLNKEFNDFLTLVAYECIN